MPRSSSRTAPPTRYASRSRLRTYSSSSFLMRPFSRARSYRCATASISTSAPEGSFATSTVERAGGRSPTCDAYTEFIPWKSSRFCRKTVVLTSLSRPVPASARIAARFAKTCSVCSSIVPPESSLSPGFSASCPETKTKSPARIACEYGAPWKGAGADSVRTTVLSATLVSFGVAGLRQRYAERLEDRIENVLRVGAVQQAHVERDARRLGEPVEKSPGDVGAEAADPRVREVDVRDEQGAVGALEHHARERLRRRHHRPAVTAPLAQRTGQRTAERAAGLGDLGLRGARLDLEGDVEAGVLHEPLEQPVEDGQARLDGGRAAPAELHANAAPSWYLLGCSHARAQATGARRR